MLWHWSLTPSIFSLVGSAQDRLLAGLPTDPPDYSTERGGSKEDLEAVLPLVLGHMMFWVWQILMRYFVLILVPLNDGHDVNLTPLVSTNFEKSY